MRYADFLQTKMPEVGDAGFAVADDTINPALYDWQRQVVAWACKKGRAALFEDCGLGKTFQQLEWARLVHEHTSGNVLILAPLAVAQQTKTEGAKIGIDVTVCRAQSDVTPGLNIANYEMLRHFDPAQFSGIVLDESSILKSYDGKTRTALTEFSRGIAYRLCCTATPAPNDLAELTNHAEFLSVMTGKEILALFFRQDGNTTHKWRLKGHARQHFWRWLAGWSVAVRSPSDLGYEDGDFILPPLTIDEVVLPAEQPVDGRLFMEPAVTLQERRSARRGSMDGRVAAAAALANDSTEPWLILCDLNDESDALKRAIPDAVEVRGSDSIEHKVDALLGFSEGRYRVMVSKPSIVGFGMNWQHCSNLAFVGLSDSYEQFYQAVRRCWRFGQKSPVQCHVITSELEGRVVENIKRKEAQAEEMMDELTKHMAEAHELTTRSRGDAVHDKDDAFGDGWHLMLGDCCERISEIPDNSVGLTVFSPPFPGMYVYTNSARDIGNCASIDELLDHFQFLMPELLRVTMPGRHVCVHLTQAVAFKHSDGYIGIKDFRGKVIERMEAAGFHYYGEVTIDKDPQIKAIRTKDRGLLFKTLAMDSAHMHMALADYLLQFRKPGDNVEPIRAGISEKYDNARGWISSEEWIEWAAPVWYRQSEHYPGGIRETEVLNVTQAREGDDERHLCPLQLGVIERCVKLWSNPNDLVLDPFNGIGSTGFEAIKWNRRYIGIELKRSYYTVSIRNLALAGGLRYGLPLDQLLAKGEAA